MDFCIGNEISITGSIQANSKQFIGNVVEINPVINEINKLIITFSFKTEKL